MQRRHQLLTLLVMVIWGFNFSAIKLAVTGINPLLMTALRFSFATLPLLVFIPRPAVSWRYLLGYGFSFGVGVWGMASWAMSMALDPGLTSMIEQLSVVFTTLAGLWLFRETLSRYQWLGITMAIVGVIVLVGLPDHPPALLGCLLLLISTLSWAVASCLVKRAAPANVFAFSLWGMAMAPLPLIGLTWLIFGGAPFVSLVTHPPLNSLLAVLFQAYPTTLFGYWVWNHMLVRYPLSVVSPLMLLVPIFGVLGGVWFYHEPFGCSAALGGALMLCGVVLVTIPLRWSWLRKISKATFNLS
ncbi:EamA family transporter [Celerinatantimonas yamalensis]|uniref:EamA family transporter n=1 Tax=Celerinatantimonas yamalensis TaxID=559956 RepID=A0ABW9G6F9_9GAMM